MSPAKFAPLLLLAFAPLALTAAPTASTPTPTTAAASSPADAAKIKTVLRTFIQAVFDGDEKATFDCLYLATDEDRLEAQAFSGRALAEIQFRRALDAEFNAATQTAPAHEPIPEDLAEQVAGAQISVNGDSAEANATGQRPIYFTRKNGAWKVDFNKTQRATEGPFDRNKIADESAHMQIVTAVLAEVQAHKYKTRSDANVALNKLQAQLLPPPTSAPAAPALETEEITDLLQRFAHAMYQGDEAAVFDLFFFASDDAKQEAQAFIGGQIAQIQFDYAIDSEFNGAKQPAPAPSNALIEILTANVTITGDTAQAAMRDTTKVIFLRQNNAWKIDFLKTQRANEGPFDKDKLAAKIARRQACQDTLAEVKAHKFPTQKDAQAALQKRLDQLAPAP